VLLKAHTALPGPLRAMPAQALGGSQNRGQNGGQNAGWRAIGMSWEQKGTEPMARANGVSGTLKPCQEAGGHS
jgi:hypothetical protein